MNTQRKVMNNQKPERVVLRGCSAAPSAMPPLKQVVRNRHWRGSRDHLSEKRRHDGNVNAVCLAPKVDTAPIAKIGAMIRTVMQRYLSGFAPRRASGSRLA